VKGRKGEMGGNGNIPSRHISPYALLSYNGGVPLRWPQGWRGGGEGEKAMNQEVGGKEGKRGRNEGGGRREEDSVSR